LKARGGDFRSCLRLPGVAPRTPPFFVSLRFSLGIAGFWTLLGGRVAVRALSLEIRGRRRGHHMALMVRPARTPLHRGTNRGRAVWAGGWRGCLCAPEGKGRLNRVCLISILSVNRCRALYAGTTRPDTTTTELRRQPIPAVLRRESENPQELVPLIVRFYLPLSCGSAFRAVHPHFHTSRLGPSRTRRRLAAVRRRTPRAAPCTPARFLVGVDHRFVGTRPPCPHGPATTGHQTSPCASC